LQNRLVNLNVDLKLARNEASHERVTALEIEIDVMKADKNELESQTAEQCVAAYALRDCERDRKRAAKELAEEAQHVAKEAEDKAKSVAKAKHDCKRAAKELAEDEAKRGAKAECDCKRAEKVAEDEARRVANHQVALLGLQRLMH
jgi:hypothetical protein